MRLSVTSSTKALPSSLRTLAFGCKLNRSLRCVALSSSLWSLTFVLKFNKSLRSITLLRGPQTLTFGDRFNQSLVLGALRGDFGYDFA